MTPTPTPRPTRGPTLPGPAAGRTRPTRNAAEVAGMRGAPPGRAGRLWLRRRLATATRTRDQLDRTLHVIELERHRLLVLEDRHRTDWERACAEGATWLARAAALVGRDGIRTATPPESLTAEVGWTTTAGAPHPLTVTVSRAPTREPPSHASSALAPAAAA